MGRIKLAIFQRGHNSVSNNEIILIETVRFYQF